MASSVDAEGRAGFEPGPGSVGGVGCDRGAVGAAVGPFFWLAAAPGCVVGSDGRVVAVNRAWEEVVGWSAREVVGRSADGLVAPADRPPVRRALARLKRDPEAEFAAGVIGRDGAVRRLIWRVTHAGGMLYLAGCHGSGPGDGGRVSGRTPRSASPLPLPLPRAQARHAVIAQVSHDIRTPLTAILGHAELALARSRGTDGGGCACGAEEHWAAVKLHGEHLVGLLGAALGGARHGSGGAPAVSALPAPAVPARRAVVGPSLPARVLVAEDNRETQQVVALRLRLAGAAVSIAPHGRAAVELARAARDEGRPFDVILMDMQMPVLDGYEATRTLRDEGFRTPVVAVTAYALPEDRAECLRFGCDEYVTKPIDWDALFALLARLIHHGRSASATGAGPSQAAAG